MDKKSRSLGRLRHRGALLFISVLLHSVLALFPWHKKSRPLAVSPPSVNSISVVDASQLPELPAPEPQPLPTVPASPPTPTIPPSPPVAIPADPPADLTPEPSAETADSPLNETETADSSDTFSDEEIFSDDTSFSDTTASNTSSSDTSDATPADEATIAAELDNFVGHLQLQNDGFASSPLLYILDTFGEPGQVEQFFDENNESKLTESTHYHFTKQTPEEVLETVVIPEVSNNTGFALQPQEDFTAGLAYQLSQGDILRYLIIVKLDERSGSVLILSDSLPS